MKIPMAFVVEGTNRIEICIRGRDISIHQLISVYKGIIITGIYCISHTINFLNDKITLYSSHT